MKTSIREYKSSANQIRYRQELNKRRRVLFSFVAVPLVILAIYALAVLRGLDSGLFITLFYALFIYTTLLILIFSILDYNTLKQYRRDYPDEDFFLRWY